MEKWPENKENRRAKSEGKARRADNLIKSFTKTKLDKIPSLGQEREKWDII